MTTAKVTTENEMDNFYVQVKNADSEETVKELGPMTERKAEKVASGMEINMSEDYYTVVIEK